MALSLPTKTESENSFVCWLLTQPDKIPPANLDRVHVSTIDGFQEEGSEIFILNLTAADRTAPGRFGFIGDSKRLNVALTRAKEGLIIVGDMGLWMTAIDYISMAQNHPEFG